MKIKYDISSQNFDNYFSVQIAGISEHEKEELPKEINYKIYKRGQRKDARDIVKLSFLSKVFILVKALRKRLVILVEDENGMNEEEYFKYKKMLPKRQITVESTKEYIVNADFALVNKEIMDTYSFMNQICSSKHYSYLTKNKNVGVNKTGQWVKEMNYINRFLSYYESNRKRLTINTGVNFSEWMILIYLYSGEYMPTITIHREWYKYSFNSSATKLKLAFSSLQSKGYIDKIGGTVGAKLRITTIGKNKVNEIMQKYVLNC